MKRILFFFLAGFVVNNQWGDENPHIVKFDVVSDNGATGDGCNAWGWHFVELFERRKGYSPLIQFRDP